MERCFYRHYELEGRLHRIGVGEFNCHTERLFQHLDIDTLDYSLSVIISGELWFKDQHDNVKILKKGDVFQRQPKALHSTCVIPTETYREQFCLMSGDLYSHFSQMALIPNDVTFRTTNTPESIKQFNRLNLALQSHSPDWYMTAMNAMQNWLFLLGTQKESSDTCYGDQKKALAKEKLLSNWNEPLPMVAKGLGLSYSAFRKWFKDEVGITPGNFRKVSRIKLGCDLLAHPDLSITHVAEVLSYPDIYSFSKQFKQVIGTTPSNFKLRMSKTSTALNG
ncbi:helix-turn-helix transcriptional regulator [Vibrio penaeicida]|uniref:helix-turn-helix transcriptional regulator n=1 Tax=Vibrio penaeicida TaxID=104609 RepID=UPI00273776D3|nr:helix-turn-helix transcriptional regulator [Vibrio penaeicida]MDP2575882.1 helix-turn-helix transcriptional regulator [Vibrio penaeicida]